MDTVLSASVAVLLVTTIATLLSSPIRGVRPAQDHFSFVAEKRLLLMTELLLVVASGTGCSSHHVRTNLTKLEAMPTPQTIQVFASSSISGRPMREDSKLRGQVASKFAQQFPTIRSDESKPDMVVFLTMSDYVPGCSPKCSKFKTYRNWNCEVEIFTVKSGSPNSDTFVFNLGGSTFNPFHDPAANCASQLKKTLRNLNSLPPPSPEAGQL